MYGERDCSQEAREDMAALEKDYEEVDSILAMWSR